MATETIHISFKVIGMEELKAKMTEIESAYEKLRSLFAEIKEMEVKLETSPD